MPAVTFLAAEHHRPLAGTKLYCLVTEAHSSELLAQGCYAALPRVGFEPATCWSQVQCSTRCATVPLVYLNIIMMTIVLYDTRHVTDLFTKNVKFKYTVC